MTALSRILFIPFSVLGGVLAGMIGKLAFRGVWSLIDEQDPPEPRDRDASWKKVVAALVLQGAIFRAARGIADRAARQAFRRLTGAWPGEQQPERR